MIDEAPIKSTVEELRKLIHISNYVGEPIESEDKILIPVTKAAIGFGIGEQKAGQQITATGAGVSVEPVTMVVVSKGNSGAIPSKRKDDEYINVDDVTEVEIQDGEIKEKAEDIVDEVEEELDIEIDDE